MRLGFLLGGLTLIAAAANSATATNSAAADTETVGAASPNTESPNVAADTVTRDNDAQTSVTLDTVTTTAQTAESAQPETPRLLRVAGAGNDPLRALEALPGVVFGRGREPAPAVRGSSPDDNAYYLDFLPAGYLFHNDGSSILSAPLTEGFTLYPAAFGPEFNGATGAVITARSRSPYKDDQQTQLDLSFLRAGILVDAPVNDDNAFFLSARMSLFQYYLENIVDSDDFEFTTVPEFYDYQGTWEYQPDVLSSWRFQVVGARDKAGLDFDETSDFVEQDPGLAGGVNIEQYFNSQGIVYDSEFASGLSVTSGLSHLEERFAFRIGQGNRINANSHRFGWRNQFRYPLSLNHELQFGVEYAERHIDYDGQFSAPPCDEFSSDCRLVTSTETVAGSGTLILRETNLNIADRWDVNRQWQLQPGALLSFHEYSGNQYIEPRLRSRYQLSEAVTWTAGYGKYHSLPGNPGEYTPEFGNPDLDETRATHYTTGIEWTLRPGLNLSSEIYYKTIDDIVVSRAPQNSEQTTAEYNALPRYTNEASGDAWGTEWLLNANVSERWYGWASLAWTRTQRTDDRSGENFRYAYDKPLVLNLVANYQWNDDWNLGLKWRYESGQLITPLIGVSEDPDTPGLYNPEYGAPFSQRLSAYHRLDIRADRSFLFNQWSMDLYLEVINLYARENVSGVRYKNADYSEREDVTDLPPLVSLGIQATF